MAERAAPLPARGTIQRRSLEWLGGRASGRTTDVTVPQVFGSLAFLLFLLVGLGSIAPQREAVASAAPAPPAISDSAARPALGPPPAMPDLAPATLPPLAQVVAAEEPEAAGSLILDQPSMLRAIGPAVWDLPSVEQRVSEASTLREVARELKVDLSALAAYNGVSADLADHPVGRSALALPTGLVEVNALKLNLPPAPPQTVRYTISEGDTLLGIALRFGVDVDALAAANGLQSPDLIRAGDQLQVSLWDRPAAAALPSAPALAPPAASGAESTPAAAEGPRARTPVTYEVLPGDTVSEIAERFGVDTDTIVGANRLSSPDTIRVGDELTILPVSGVLHTVREGETLLEIAGLYKVDLGPIIDFNYLEDQDLIRAGDELLIPGAKPLPPPPPGGQSTSYRVAPGDTLSGIAARFGVSPAAIARANSLANPDRLSIGVQLLIPGVSGPLAQQQVVTRNLPMFTPSAASNAQLPASAASSTIASVAMRYLGSRYVYGGTSPSGFDCSGFVYYVLAQSGRPVSRGMWGQYNAGPHPSRANLQPGDIVFFQNTYMPGLSHNGIYLGGGQFIHASDERSGVKISNLNDPYWSSRWFGATRVS